MKKAKSRSGIRVSVVIGSDTDLPIMSEAVAVLEEFGIGHEVRILSAHRTPEAAVRFARAARGRGIEVIIGGAGGAAHLAGVIAAHTILPVLSVPMPTTSLYGIDSLYSIVQMPGGVPVAALAIGKPGARNAGILAAEILALRDAGIARKLEAARAGMRKGVIEKDRRIARIGVKRYLAGMAASKGGKA
jgi:phosphoribosylaminoimidazole carboxylase PurE protein